MRNHCRQFVWHGDLLSDGFAKIAQQASISMQGLGAPNTMRAKSGWRGLMRMLRSAGTTALGTLNSAVWAPCSHACPMD